MRLGADPEVFICNAKGTPISIIDKIGGTKEAPKQIGTLPVGYTVQEDNVALEFGIPPATSKAAFITSIKQVMLHSLPLIKKPTEKGIVKFSKLSCVVFPKKELSHPLANIFGCEPDFNAWTKEENPRPIPPFPNLRSAGGHIHMETKENPIEIVRAMDLFISVPAVLLDNGSERKKIYGKAGAFRYKPYGVEYRSPSNFWIFSEILIGWIWDSSVRAHSFVSTGRDLSGVADQIQYCINNDNKKLAKKLIDHFSLPMPKGYKHAGIS